MKVSFKNFKSFTRLTEVNLARFNVVIGQNSAGKTAFTNAIQIFTNLLNNKFKSSEYNMFNDISKSALLNEVEDSNETGVNVKDVHTRSLIIDRSPFKIAANGMIKYYHSFTMFPFDTKNNHDSPTDVQMNYFVTTRLRRFDFNSGSRKMLNEEISSKYDNVDIDIYNKSINYHLRDLNSDNHTLSVRYSNNTITHFIESRNDFLNGLVIVSSKNLNDGQFLLHEDGSFIKNTMDKCVNQLTKDIFKDELDLIDESFKEFKLQNKIKKWELSFPKKVDKTNYDHIGDLVSDTLIPMVQNETRRNWIMSPYVASDYNQSNQRFFNNNNLKTPRYLSNLFRSLTTPLRFRQAKRGVKKFSDLEFPKYFKQTSGPFTLLNDSSLDSDTLYNNFYDYNLYKDFFLADFMIKKPSSEWAKIRNAKHPDTGPLFHSTTGIDFTHFKDHIDYLEKTKNDRDKISKFINNIGYGILIGKYFDINKDFEFGALMDIKNQDFGKSHLALASAYHNEFKNIFKSYLDDRSKIENTKNISKIAKNYNLPKSAIVHQINVLNRYLLRTMIVQFQTNMYKYMYFDYKEKLFKVDSILFVDRTADARQTINTTIIKPAVMDRSNKTKIFFSARELDELFNGNFNDIFKSDESSIVLNVTEKQKLNHFNKFVNDGLKKMGMNYQLLLENRTIKSGDTDTELRTNQYLLQIKMNKPEIVIPLNECGMGNTILISVLGSMYKATNMPQNTMFGRKKFKNKEIVVIREPETYLHPLWISNLCEYLFELTLKNKNLKLIIETHSEQVLRKTQLLVKDFYKSEIGRKNKTFVDDLVKVLYVERKTRAAVPFSDIADLGIKNNGFLSKKIPTGFYDVNTNLISRLWKDKK